MFALHEAVQIDRWNHTASILCQQANLNRGAKRPFPISKFHPFWAGSQREGIRLTPENIGDFKPWFKNSITITAAEAKASLEHGNNV